MPRVCQRPGCTNLVTEVQGRFCGAVHQREDQIDRQRSKRQAAKVDRPEAVKRARALLKRLGLCSCIKCDGTCATPLKTAKPKTVKAVVVA